MKKKVNKKTIIIIILIGIICLLILNNLNEKNTNIYQQEKNKKQLEETLDNAYVGMQTHLSEVNDREQKLLSFKNKIVEYIKESGGIEPLNTEDTTAFGESIKGIVTEVTKDASATADTILEGYTAYVNGNKVIGTMQQISQKDVFYYGYTCSDTSTVTSIKSNLTYTFKNDGVCHYIIGTNQQAFKVVIADKTVFNMTSTATSNTIEGTINVKAGDKVTYSRGDRSGHNNTNFVFGWVE